MAYHKATEDIQAAWDALTGKWAADVKSRYFDQIYIPLVTEADDIYRRNEDLEYYAASCVNAVR